MLKLTPNSVKRPKGVRLQFEKSTDGLYVVRNAYEGHYEYFKGRPLGPREERGTSSPVVLKKA
jgi:hypothetical protein